MVADSRDELADLYPELLDAEPPPATLAQATVRQ
ncbi:MAG: hypothetical protein K0Q72_5070, partial [Armatimonadetes bacterium]|nr:hypothetical protein [Armatimonadota bacterium]